MNTAVLGTVVSFAGDKRTLALAKRIHYCTVLEDASI